MEAVATEVTAQELHMLDIQEMTYLYKTQKSHQDLQNMQTEILTHPRRNWKPLTQTEMFPKPSTLSMLPYRLSNQRPLKQHD